MRESVNAPPGAHIEVRDAVWRVVRVDTTSTGSKAWHTVGVSEIVRDQDAIFLEEYEPEVTVLDPRDTQLVLDSSPGHRAARLFLESKLRRVPPLAEKPELAKEAAMDVLDFQLEPTKLALQQTRPRILIADAVGLGKTLECGILLSELIRRGRARRILVATVKSMLTQFQKELWSRFAIPLVRLDSVGLQRVREQIPTNHNPFHYYDKAIISIDTLKQNNAFRTHVEQAEWDVIVIDEAHNVAARGSSRSARAKIAQVLSRQSEGLVLLSATPHDGKATSFASLMTMLDPTAIADPTDYDPEDIRGLFVRRFKKDVQEEIGKAFPERTIEQVHAQASDAEEEVFDALVDLSFTAIDQRRHGALLFKTTLEKALLSSPAACLETLRHRIQTIRRRDDTGRFEEDIESLESFRDRVERVEAKSFAKYQRLLKLLKDKKGFGWSPRKKDDRLVIFSERIETLRWLQEQLSKDLKLKDDQVALLHGGLGDQDQMRIVEEFGQEHAKVRLLLASDVASEGLNLHFLCHRLVHFDVPWSLMTFAQRNGRIDRYGQEREPQILYLLTDTENDKVRGDMRILELLTERDEQARENIGDPSALMGKYDVQAEEEVTGRAIEEGQSAEDFDAGLATTEQALNPLELFLQKSSARAAEPEPPTEPELSSLFPSDFDFVRTTVDWLAEEEGLEREVREDDRILELTLPPDTEQARRARAPGLDLRRRFRKLPAEVLPEDSVLVLTPDRDTMQSQIARARREESAWPTVSYLWALHPVVDWCCDKATGQFGRMTAPVLTLVEGLEDDEAVVIVSGLLPNRRAQPLLHQWYAARFKAGALQGVEPFAEWAEEQELATRRLPNRTVEANLAGLRDLLAPAIEAVTKRVMESWKAREDRLNNKLQEELDRLEELRRRRFDQLDFDIDKDELTEAQQKERRQIDALFDPFFDFISESMTAGTEPFLEVLAVFRPEPLRSEKGYLADGSGS
jgi:superfamily II DNA/RNA helicase